MGVFFHLLSCLKPFSYCSTHYRSLIVPFSLLTPSVCHVLHSLAHLLSLALTNQCQVRALSMLTSELGDNGFFFYVVSLVSPCHPPLFFIG